MCFLNYKFILIVGQCHRQKRLGSANLSQTIDKLLKQSVQTNNERSR